MRESGKAERQDGRPLNALVDDSGDRVVQVAQDQVDSAPHAGTQAAIILHGAHFITRNTRSTRKSRSAASGVELGWPMTADMMRSLRLSMTMMPSKKSKALLLYVQGPTAGRDLERRLHSEEHDEEGVAAAHEFLQRRRILDAVVVHGKHHYVGLRRATGVVATECQWRGDARTCGQLWSPPEGARETRRALAFGERLRRADAATQTRVHAQHWP